MRILGIIPARSGSKGVKNKNIRILKNKPFPQRKVKKKIKIIKCNNKLLNIYLSNL